MKLLALLISFLVSLGVSAQTIGDHLNAVKEKQPSGKVEYKNDGTRYTVNTESGTQTVYFFDLNLKCDVIAIRPGNAAILQGLIEKFNREFVIMSTTSWRYYRTDDILQMSLVTVDDVGRVFYLKKLAQ
jgi:hypothetical protein